MGTLLKEAGMELSDAAGAVLRCGVEGELNWGVVGRVLGRDEGARFR